MTWKLECVLWFRYCMKRFEYIVRNRQNKWSIFVRALSTENIVRFPLFRYFKFNFIQLKNYQTSPNPLCILNGSRDLKSYISLQTIQKYRSFDSKLKRTFRISHQNVHRFIYQSFCSNHWIFWSHWLFIAFIDNNVK